MLEPTVLLVADETRIRTSVKAALQKRGYRVLAARGSLEAFAEAAKHPVDALIAKVDLPGVRGPALARILSQAFPGLPVMYLLWRRDGGDRAELQEVNEPVVASSTEPAAVADQLDRMMESRNRKKPASNSSPQGGSQSQIA